MGNKRASGGSRSSGASRPFGAAEAALRAHAMAKPEATEHFPWGERAIKVKGKVFLFMYSDASKLSLSTKLPESSDVALILPFAQPTGYGLGKAGWVSASFEAGAAPPVELLCSWIDESYQAVAPAKLASLARGAAASSPGASDGHAATTAARRTRRPPAKARPSTKPAKAAAKRPAKPAAKAARRRA
jgi:predicted DNA-binding protein (MmcQ/YjbR family)